MTLPQRLMIALCAFSLSFAVQAFQSNSALKATTLLKTTETWAGQAIEYPQGTAEITATLIELAVGGETGWHRHPVLSVGYILQGELEVRLRDGRTKRLKAGDALAEVFALEHNGRNVGSEPVKLVVFYTGSQGDTLTTFVTDSPEQTHQHE